MLENRYALANKAGELSIKIHLLPSLVIAYDESFIN